MKATLQRNLFGKLVIQISHKISTSAIKSAEKET